MTEESAADPSPGWYPDPAGRAEQRWWDGHAWTASVSDGQVTRVDMLGLPVAAEPGQLTTVVVGSGGGSARGARVRKWIAPAAGVAVLIALVVGLVSVVRGANDRADDEKAARKDLKEQVRSLGHDVSDLSSQISDLSSSEFGYSSDFSDYAPSFASCDVLFPEDVQAALGITVHVDHTIPDEYLCTLETDQVENGTAILVHADYLDGDVQDQLNVFPTRTEPRRLVAGDEAYVTNAYGSLAAVAAKNGAYVSIQIETGGALPTDDQMAALLTAAAGRL